MARALRSPETKARDALALADRKVARLDARLAKAVAAASAIDNELQAAVVERDYAAANPALHMDTLSAAHETVGVVTEVSLNSDGVLVTGVLGDQAESSEPETAEEIRAAWASPADGGTANV